MYTEYTNTNRNDWKFVYAGADLFEAARTKYHNFLADEKEARQRMAKLMVDMSVAQSDPRINDCKKEIEKAGAERERCMVWMHEFERRPEKQYFLLLGDVTYFGLAPEPQ